MPEKHDKNRPHWFSLVWCSLSLPPSSFSCPSYCPHHLFLDRSITMPCTSFCHWQDFLIAHSWRGCKWLAEKGHQWEGVASCCPNLQLCKTAWHTQKRPYSEQNKNHLPLYKTGSLALILQVIKSMLLAVIRHRAGWPCLSSECASTGCRDKLLFISSWCH